MFNVIKYNQVKYSLANRYSEEMYCYEHGPLQSDMFQESILRLKFE